MSAEKITFVEKDSFETQPLPFSTKGVTLIPVFMNKGGKEYFVYNRKPSVGDPDSLYNKQQNDVLDAMKLMLCNNGGRYAKSSYGKFDCPYELIQYVKDKKCQFISGEHKFNHIETLFSDCRGVDGYGEGFVDFGGNIRQVSCAFSFRIYDNEMVRELKELVRKL